MLLLDDDEAHRLLMAREVSNALPDAHVHIADCGFSAVLAMGAQMPDVLITDPALSDVDGLALLHHLTDRPQGGPGQIIVTSAAAANAAHLPAGAMPLRKPVNRTQLRRLLQHAAERHGQESPD